MKRKFTMRLGGEPMADIRVKISLTQEDITRAEVAREMSGRGKNLNDFLANILYDAVYSAIEDAESQQEEEAKRAAYVETLGITHRSLLEIVGQDGE